MNGTPTMTIPRSVAIGLSLMLLAGCNRESPDTLPAQHAGPTPVREASTGASHPATAVPTEIVTAGPTAGRVTVTALVRQDLHLVAQVVPRVPGRVLEVHAHFGDTVKRGQTLALLDSLDVGDARLALRQARIQLELAQAEYARIAPLVDEEVLPRKELVRAAAERDKAGAAAETARQRLRMLGVDPSVPNDHAGVPSSFALTAPLTGVVLDERAIVGELATSDRPLFSVGDLSRVWIEGNLTDRQIGRVRIGAAAEVTVDAYPGEVFRGKVTYLGGALDPTTRTLVARVEIDNRDLRLKPQMFARMGIVTGETTPQVSVPASAVLLLQGEPSVFVVEGHAFVPRPVEPGETVGDRIVILRGLAIGDRVAVGDVFELKAKLLKSQIGDEH
ncbi:MAG: efflux RND transporter periplasmic adaptor subunit [Burkholderiales bacterium]|nr:efflux RND transporter periplasmic adaptor subunit [Burkholderiales bacterium]